MRLVFFLTLCFSTLMLHAQKNIHELWTNELQRYVDKQGNVNYETWKKNPQKLVDYLKTLEENPPQEYWTKNDSLAYFINVYNAATVKLILDNYPLKSIRHLITPWRFKVFQLHDKKVSLNHIEHEILRKMNEPRIHFAINCASASCPKLLNKAFYSHTMGKQLKKATIEFINDPKRNQITKDKLYLSRIFQWFAKDFGTKKERLAFINKHAQQPIDTHAKVKFLNYDWQLNE